MDESKPEHPGKVVETRLNDLGWSQMDLANIIGKPKQLVSDVILGKRAVTPETASLLADAFGTSAEYWRKLQSYFDLEATTRIIIPVSQSPW